MKRCIRQAINELAGWVKPGPKAGVTPVNLSLRYIPSGLLLFFLLGCGRVQEDYRPTIKPPQPLGKEFSLQEMLITVRGERSRLWVYLPATPSKRSEIKSKSLPCVFVPPAGSSGLTGKKLVDDDRPEHLPYLHQGFAVVAFELNGNLNSEAGFDDLELAIREFQQVEGGLLNLQAAMEMVKQHVPAIDTDRFYIAGHSSAGAVALALAVREPRLKACLAFSPVADYSLLLSTDDRRAFRQAGYEEFIKSLSPMTYVRRWRCPLFLFHATGDQQVSISHSNRFFQSLPKSADVTYIRYPGGDHYDCVIARAIPEAAKWLAQLDRKREELASTARAQ